jgi:hypothetical protein
MLNPESQTMPKFKLTKKPPVIASPSQKDVAISARSPALALC